MELRKINKNDAKAQWEYTTALPTDENGLTNPYNGVSYDDYIEKVLPTLISYEHPVNMPDWFVPETYYYLWDDGRLVGEFRIRHHLTEALKSGAGHIGYSIKREERGKGYGTEGLKLTLQEARKLIPEDEIYLRVNKDNIASQKVMQKNGGKVVGEDDGHFFVRIPKYFDCGMEKENYWFRYRTGAIIVRDNKMLFVKSKFGGYYYMIGGGVHLGEDSKSCVERETYEETGVKCTARRIAIICENFFRGVGGAIDGKDCHELEYYYLMDMPKEAIFETSTDDDEKLEWVALNDLSNNDIRPAFLKTELKGVIEGGSLIHVINDERNTY